MSWVERHLVKEALAELAHASFQERLWLAAAGPEVGSLVEAMSQLFDDSGLGNALEAGGEPVFAVDIDDALAGLRTRLKPIVSRPRAPSDILADERMPMVRELAGTVLFDIVRLEAMESRVTEA